MEDKIPVINEPHVTLPIKGGRMIIFDPFLIEMIEKAKEILATNPSTSATND